MKCGEMVYTEMDSVYEKSKLTKLGTAGIIIAVLLLFAYSVYLLFYAHTVYKHIDKSEAEEVVAHFEKFVETTYSKKHAGLLNIILNARNRDTEYNLKLFNDNTNYTHETNAFGERGTLKSSDGNIHVTFSDSYRDGIYVQVKRYQPWRILLEYSNGTTLIYDDENKHYEPWLKNLVELIEKFRLQKKSKRYLRHFEDLKRRIYESILNSTFKKDFGL